MDKSEIREFIEKRMYEECKGKDCLLKDIVSRLFLSTNFFEQFKCNEKFKNYKISQERKEIIENISPKGDNKKNCLLKEILARSDLSDRTLQQWKCLERFKDEMRRQGKEVKHQQTAFLFIEKYGKKFDEVYQKGIKNGELYNKIMEK